MGPTTGALFTLPGETMAFFGVVAVLFEVVAVLGAILILSKRMSVKFVWKKVRSRQLGVLVVARRHIPVSCRWK
jgi:hypothetical protein